MTVFQFIRISVDVAFMDQKHKTLKHLEHLLLKYPWVCLCVYLYLLLYYCENDISLHQPLVNSESIWSCKTSERIEATELVFHVFWINALTYNRRKKFAKMNEKLYQAK